MRMKRKGKMKQRKKKDSRQKWVWILHTFLAVKIIPPLKKKKQRNKQKVHSFTWESTLSLSLSLFLSFSQSLFHSHKWLCSEWVIAQSLEHYTRTPDCIREEGKGAMPEPSMNTLKVKAREEKVYLNKNNFWVLEGHVNDGNYDKYCQRMSKERNWITPFTFSCNRAKW